MAKRGSVKVKDVDHGYKGLVALVKRFFTKPTGIAVGILEKNAGRSDGKTTVLQVGTWNEFGTKRANGDWHVPPRSFIRAWFDINRTEGYKRLSRLMKQVVAGKITEEQALNRFGLWAQGSIQKRMATSIPPVNAPSTIRRKHSETTLINTGQLRASISYEIRRK